MSNIQAILLSRGAGNYLKLTDAVESQARPLVLGMLFSLYGQTPSPFGVSLSVSHRQELDQYTFHRRKQYQDTIGWLSARQPELHTLLPPHPHASSFTKFPRVWSPGRPSWATVSASDQGAGAREDWTIGVRLQTQTQTLVGTNPVRPQYS